MRRGSGRATSAYRLIKAATVRAIRPSPPCRNVRHSATPRQASRDPLFPEAGGTGWDGGTRRHGTQGQRHQGHLRTSKCGEVGELHVFWSRRSLPLARGLTRRGLGRVGGAPCRPTRKAQDVAKCCPHEARRPPPPLPLPPQRVRRREGGEGQEPRPRLPGVLFSGGKNRSGSVAARPPPWRHGPLRGGTALAVPHKGGEAPRAAGPPYTRLNI